MTNQLALSKINSDNFYGSSADFYQDENNDIYMTIEQVANCLGYRTRSGIDKMIANNEYLREPEFTIAEKISGMVQNRSYETTLITEDGIYEITMLSKKPKAKEFRAFVRKILKGLRKQELDIIQTNNNQQLNVQNELNKLYDMVTKTNTKLERIENIIWTLVPPKQYYHGDWAKAIYAKVNRLAEEFETQSKVILHNIYAKMRIDYDIDVNTYQRQYLQEHPEVNRISPVDIMDQDTELQAPFESILDNYSELFAEVTVTH